MVLEIGAAYSVVICARPIIRNGQTRRSWCDYDNKQILIAENAPQRSKLLRHEIWHAWTREHSVPEQADAEELAEQFSACSSAFDSQFAAQGGQGTLDAIMPMDKEVNDPAKVRGSLAARALSWRCCGNCSAPVAPGSIETYNLAWNDAYGCHVVQRDMRCDCCDAKTFWHEKAMPDGTPTGEVCEWPKPRVEARSRMAV